VTLPAHAQTTHVFVEGDADAIDRAAGVGRVRLCAALQGIDNEEQVRDLDRQLHDLRRGITQQMEEARSELAFSRFKQGAWEPFIEKGALPKDLHITSIITIGQDSSLVATQQNGLFILSGDRLIPFTPSGKGFSPYQNFSGAVQVDDECFIVGTYTNGFYLINKKGQVLENLSKREGLQNNNVRSVFMDRNHNIWLGLDSGIDFIAFNNAIKHINLAVMNSGSGYAAVIHHNKLFLGLSNGIYELPLPDVKDLSYAPNECKIIAEGQTWGLSLINDRLLAGKDAGFFEVKDDKK